MRLWQAALGASIITFLITYCIVSYRPVPIIEPDAEELLPPELYVEFAPDVREFLVTEWDKRDHQPSQVERGYCLSYEIQVDANDNNEEYYYVTKIAKPIFSTLESPVGTYFTCPRGTVALHTHPPTTCKVRSVFGVIVWKADSCRMGGSLAYQCQPSGTDQDTLYTEWIERGDLFSVIQCDRNALVPYYPH